MWCIGGGSTSSCQGKAVKENYPVTVRVAELPVLAQPTVQVMGPARAGRPLTLVVEVDQQLWPTVKEKGWLWLVGSRPVGSTAWLYADQQFTDQPWLRMIPDRAGKMAFYMAYRVKDPLNEKYEHWSVMRSLQVVVQP